MVDAWGHGEHEQTAWLDRVRATQALAYACVEQVAGDLYEGQTERDVAAAMEQWLRRHGVREWFHQPFAWFGERTAFVASSRWTPLHFFPTGTRLRNGMPVILDVAPVFDGAAADVGYACWFGTEPSPLHERLLADLEPYRDLVLEGVRAGDHLNRIYRRVDELLADQGLQSRHRAYPFSVIAHRMEDGPPVTPPGMGALRGRRFGGFGLGAQRFLLGELGAAVRGVARAPLWNGGAMSDHPANVGLWAVEPHLAFGAGRDSIGVKWEEILVVTESDAFWLDDDLPHVRRWTRANEGAPA